MQKVETAYFAGGCFWGVEYHFQHLPGVVATAVGYMGGEVDNPSYEQVCSGITGHIETLEVIFDPAIVKYETLVKLFFEIHDFSQKDGQGPDIGEQYRSEIFYVDALQKTTAWRVIGELQDKKYTVQTLLSPIQMFWKAEEYHQQYYQKNGHEPYCHIRKKIF